MAIRTRFLPGSGGSGYSSGAAVFMNVDASRFEALLTDVERTQLPFATALALTNTAKRAQEDVRSEMRKVFDRPVPYTLRGVTIERATKALPVATVRIAGQGVEGLPPSAYLYPQIFGGQRGVKSFEKALQARGLMPSGWVSVPASGVKLNAYGNIPASLIVRILADLQIEARGAGSTRARTARSLKRNANYRTARYFVAHEGSHLAKGIWLRNPKTNTIKPVVLFVQRQVYTQRLDFHRVVRVSATRNFAPEFAAAFKRAMATARR